MASGRFLLWTAVSCAVAVGLCTWLAGGSSTGVRAIAALIGLGIGLLVVFLVAWAMPDGGAVPVEAAATAPARAPVTPIAHEPVVLPPSPPEPAPPPPADLAARLEEGRALDPSTDAVDAWIDATKRSLAEHRPGVLGYFSALGSKAFPDDRARLDAHLARLETIVRG